MSEVSLATVITVSRNPKPDEWWTDGCEGVDSVIRIDGRSTTLSAGYNEGARESTAEWLVFSHDDVNVSASHLIDSILDNSKNERLGFIGIAGSRTIGKSSSWWTNGPECRGACHHPHNPRRIEMGWRRDVWPGPDAMFGPVAVLDGVLLVCRKSLWEELGGFDERFRFHFYDIDITLRASMMEMENIAADIPCYHQSPGPTGLEWRESAKMFVEKHKEVLPFRVP